MSQEQIVIAVLASILVFSAGVIVAAIGFAIRKPIIVFVKKVFWRTMSETEERAILNKVLRQKALDQIKVELDAEDRPILGQELTEKEAFVLKNSLVKAQIEVEKLTNMSAADAGGRDLIGQMDQATHDYGERYFAQHGQAPPEWRG